MECVKLYGERKKFSLLRINGGKLPTVGGSRSFGYVKRNTIRSLRLGKMDAQFFRWKNTRGIKQIVWKYM